MMAERTEQKNPVKKDKPKKYPSSLPPVDSLLYLLEASKKTVRNARWNTMKAEE